MDNKIKFALKGRTSDDKEISVDNVPIKLLQSFLSDINGLISSVGERAKTEDLTIGIEKGSFAVSASKLYRTEYNMIANECVNLFKTKDLLSVDKERQKYFENFKKMTEYGEGTSVSIQIEEQKYIIDRETTFFLKNKPIIVDEELYLYGVITSLGGKKKSNIHLVNDDDNLTYVIDIDRRYLEDEDENRLYKTTGIRVSASYDVIHKKYTKYTFLEFIKYNPVYDELELDRLIEKGTKVWADIDDHNAWIRAMRGDDDE